jgi:cytochrome P450
MITYSEAATTRVIELPPTKDGEPAATWPVRDVSLIAIGLRTHASPGGLASMFRGDEVLRVKLRSGSWFFGRGAAWTRHVAGSRSMWADLDILPLGLRSHPRYYAMGGLPGAPPGLHGDVRKTALASGFRTALSQSVIDEARTLALALALDPSRRRIDARKFARVLCLRVTASVICGIAMEASEILQVLTWFDEWSAIIARQIALIALPPVPRGPAQQLRGVLGRWYSFLDHALERSIDGQRGLVAALRQRVSAGEVTREQAVGYLATILFAGTEPPSNTLLWGYAQCTAVTPPQGWRDVTPERAEQLLWEAFRVQPAVNYLIRRIAAGDGRYESASSDVFVVAPPLTHRQSNIERGLPTAFTPALELPGNLDPYAYPGLGTGAHYCLGARLGMAVTRDALAFLLNETTPTGRSDPSSSGRVMAVPRKLAVPVLR